MRAAKTLAWQESRWQHYFLEQGRVFVLISHNSYNALADWGITQIARSTFQKDRLLNTNFFDSKGFCNISSSLYYGFLEYLFCYLEAKNDLCNGRARISQMIGGYNRYSSGFDSCYFKLSKEDENYRNYQKRALQGFYTRYVEEPWKSAMEVGEFPKSNAGSPEITLYQGGVVRGPKDRKHIALLFSLGDQADGLPYILDTLKKHGVQASFFAIGSFLKNKKNRNLIRQLTADGHYLGPHSDGHLELVDWKSRNTLVRKDQFDKDLANNIDALASLGVPKESIVTWLPPFETFNEEIARWSKESFGLTTLGFSSGTKTPLDWFPEGHKKFVSSEEIVKSIFDKEKSDPNGLNGFFLFMHSGVGDRKDKLFRKLAGLVTTLKGDGYYFLRADHMVFN